MEEKPQLLRGAEGAVDDGDGAAGLGRAGGVELGFGAAHV